MNEVYTQFISILYGIWRNRKVALAVAWGVSILGWLYISQIPNTYESKTRLHFDTDTILNPLMQDLTVVSNIFNQILSLRETLLSPENIENTINNTELKNIIAPNGSLSQEELDFWVEDIQSKFRIDPESSTLFSMSYTHENPIVAHGVTKGFLDAFMSGQFVDASQELTGALAFIETQLVEQEAKLAEAEKIRSEFVQENMGFLSTTGQTYFEQLGTARAEVTAVQLQIDELESQRQQIITYRDELPPFVAAFGVGPMTGAQRVTIETRIAAMVTQLDELYVTGKKDAHPDVVIVKEQIRSLEEQLAGEKQQMETALNTGDTSGLTSMDGLRPNPLFDQLSIRLIDVEGEIARLEARKLQREGVVDSLLALSQRVPEVEAEEARLNRDYEILLENYNLLLGKREEARMTQVLEDTSQGIDYSLLEAPVLPTEPASPNRLFLIILSMFVGIVTGCGVAFIMNQFHNTFSSEQRLRDVFDLPVLGSVSAILSKQDEILRRRNLITSSAMFGGLFVASIFVYVLLEQMNSSVV